MKKIIAELDKIAQYMDDIEENWAFNIVWRLDRVSQQLSEFGNKDIKNDRLSKIGKKVLGQYLDKMEFLTKQNGSCEIFSSVYLTFNFFKNWSTFVAKWSRLTSLLISNSENSSVSTLNKNGSILTVLAKSFTSKL